MVTTMPRRTTREATPQRWQRALERAIDAAVQVRQLAGSGAWVATSASDPSAAYEVGVTGEIAHDCTCRAAEFGDPVCCHRAMWFHVAGLLDLDPEPPTPAAPAPAIVPCWECRGTGDDWADPGGSAPQVRVPCPACRGTGEAEEVNDEGDGDEGGDAAPYDVRGLSSAQVVALKADALRRAVAHGAPLVDPFSGRVIDRHNCRDAA